MPDGRTVNLVDTGGVMGEEDDWTVLVKKQMKLAVECADVLLFVTDARTGPHPGDEELLRFFPALPAKHTASACGKQGRGAFLFRKPIFMLWVKKRYCQCRPSAAVVWPHF